MSLFNINKNFKITAAQNEAIEKITDNFLKNKNTQTLLGITGSGKTFVMANIIKKLNIPTLIISHNKTLTAQLFGEFKFFFPQNNIGYFVSYYDYYQPESYIPQTDSYIAKDASINDVIDRLRLDATSRLITYKDTIIVSSVSCIYGLGSPEVYKKNVVNFKKGQNITQRETLQKLLKLHYERNDFEIKRGGIKVAGENIFLAPSYGEDIIRFSFFGDDIEEITVLKGDDLSVIEKKDEVFIYPSVHFLTDDAVKDEALRQIEEDMKKQADYFKAKGEDIFAQRITQRTKYDIEMIQELGYVSGIENYSRYFDGRKEGEPPYTLIDYFPKKFLIIIDESHVTLPQIRAMYNGDRARKETLVNFGFRLPAAFDNRPFKWAEFEEIMKKNYVLFVSATPADYERKNSVFTELLVRPTGLVDPEIIIRPASGQVNDCLSVLRETAKDGDKSLVITLTKASSEKMSEFLKKEKIKARYMHSEIKTLDRVKILQELREGKIKCIVGVNLLREGIDLPEVSRIFIFDADKQGFLRSKTSLIQIAGRASRNINGKVYMYADKITDAIKETNEITDKRRRYQLAYNEKHNIKPEQIKSRLNINALPYEKTKQKDSAAQKITLNKKALKKMNKAQLYEMMIKLANDLKFEEAAYLRDYLFDSELAE